MARWSLETRRLKCSPISVLSFMLEHPDTGERIVASVQSADEALARAPPRRPDLFVDSEPIWAY
jgi:hypothetical protein